MPRKPAWGFKLRLCLYRLKNNFLEQQLEEFNDKTREIEQALYEKQMQMAGTVFNKHDYMPKREVRKLNIVFIGQLANMLNLDGLFVLWVDIHQVFKTILSISVCTKKSNIS